MCIYIYIYTHIYTCIQSIHISLKFRNIKGFLTNKLDLLLKIHNSIPMVVLIIKVPTIIVNQLYRTITCNNNITNINKYHNCKQYKQHTHYKQYKQYNNCIEQPQVNSTAASIARHMQTNRMTSRRARARGQLLDQ